MTHARQSAIDLDVLRSLKRRAEELAASHLEALDLFHLDARPGAVAKLRDEEVGVGGFASFVVGDDTAGT